MSVIIHMENFPNLSAVFQELERREKQKSLKPVQPEMTKIQKQQGQPQTLNVKQLQLSWRYHHRELNHLQCNAAQTRERMRRSVCSLTDRSSIYDDDRLTPAAKNLNEEQLALLYEDILKPLDFGSILHERRKLAPTIEEQ